MSPTLIPPHPPAMDAEYRHALARYHASLRENLLTAVWSRPAHESYSPPCAECPPLQKSHNVVNPLTGRRLGSDPRLPTPEGRDVIRREARAAYREREYLAPPMERSHPVPDSSFHDAQETQHVHAEPSGPTARHHSFPTRRPPLNHRGTSSSSFGIRGRVPNHHTGSPAQIAARAIRTLGREPRQSSFHGFPKGRDTGWRGMSSSSSSSDDDGEDQNEDVPPLSHRSSTSSLAITSPTCPGSPSDPPNISAARHSIDDTSHDLSTVAKPPHNSTVPILHLPTVPPTSPVGPLHRPHPSRKASTMTLPTPTTDASESSFAALAPSPFFPPPHTQVDEFPGLKLDRVGGEVSDRVARVW